MEEPQTLPPPQALENIVNALGSYDPTTHYELEQALLGKRGSRDLEDIKELMRDTLKGVIENYQKHLFAKSKNGMKLFIEAEECIFQEGADGVFSFDNICEVLEMSPSYVRRGLREWKERQLKVYPHYTSKPKKSEQDIGRLLTDMQKDALMGIMIAACNPTIKYSQIIKLAMSEIGAKTTRSVEYLLHEAYSRLKAHDIPCHDMPSALYITLHYGILNLNDIPSQKLKSLVKGVENLIPDEKRLVKAYGKLALGNGRTGDQYLRRFLKISRKQFATRTSEIYEKFGAKNNKESEAKNTSYLAIASYYLNSERQSGALKHVA